MEEQLDRLEKAVESLIRRSQSLEEEVENREKRAEGLEKLVEDFSDGEQSPTSMAERITTLEVENRELLLRVERARDILQRVLIKVRFLEDQG